MASHLHDSTHSLYVVQGPASFAIHVQLTRWGYALTFNMAGASYRIASTAIVSLYVGPRLMERRRANPVFFFPVKKVNPPVKNFKKTFRENNRVPVKILRASTRKTEFCARENFQKMCP